MTPEERKKFEKKEQRREREERQRLQQVEEANRQRVARADNLLDFLAERLGNQVPEILKGIDELGGYFLRKRYQERTTRAASVKELSARGS
jgi:hypothetical protein